MKSQLSLQFPHQNSWGVDEKSYLNNPVFFVLFCFEVLLSSSSPTPRRKMNCAGSTPMTDKPDITFMNLQAILCAADFLLRSKIRYHAV